MNVSGVSGSSFFDFGSALKLAPVRALEPTGDFRDKRSSLGDLARMVVDVRKSLGRLSIASEARTRSASAGSLANAVSAASLGLDLQPTFASTASSEEVNAAPNSFSPFQPDVDGNSTSELIVSGEYSGENGDTTLTFELRKTGIVGSSNLRIKVKDGNQTLESVDINSSYVPGTEIALDNGLTVSFSAGTQIKNDEYEIDVFAGVGSVVDPDQQLDGTGNDNPNFQYGQGISTGSFVINGTSIDVLAGDTLNTLLDRITASAAGVTAAFDPASESVTLTQKTGGSAYQITLGSDGGTGFFDATKLSAATPVLGEDPEPEQALAGVPALASIQSGTLWINAVEIDIDVSVDSLTDILDRINASGAGVVATFSQTTGKVGFVGGAATSFVLDDGTSGFFSGVDIAEGTYTKSAGRAGELTFERPSSLRDSLADLGETLQALFKTEFASLAAGESAKAKSQLELALTALFDSSKVKDGGRRLDSSLGIGFHFDHPTGDVLRLDSAALHRALDRSPAKLAAFLVGAKKDGSEGLLGALDDVVAAIEASVIAGLEPGAAAGLGLDLLA